MDNNMDIKKVMIPKKKVMFLYSDMTIGEVIEKHVKQRYSTVPVLERESGRYLYSLSAGDILYRLLKDNDIEKPKKSLISEVSVERFIIPCSIDTPVEKTRDLILSQNFIPVVDASGVFLGILTRQGALNDLIAHLRKK